MRNAVRSLALVAVAAAQVPIARATMQASAGAGPGVIDIRHKNVGCVVAGLHPRFDACMFDPAQLGLARVYFRAAGTAYWYFVTMAAEPGANPGCLTGTLPKIKESMVGQDVDVYLETTDKRLGINQIPPYDARVVAKEGDCDPKKIIAPGVPKASVVVGAAPGAPATPFGFVGGGISATTLGLGAVGLAGVGGGVYALSSGGGGGTTLTPTPTPTPFSGGTATPTPITPTPPTPTPETPTPVSPQVLTAAVTPIHGEYGIALHVTWSATSSCSHVKLALGPDAPFHVGLPVSGSFDVEDGDAGYPPAPGSYHYRAVCAADSSVERYTNVVTLDPKPTPTPRKGATPLQIGSNDTSTSTLQITLDVPGVEAFVLVNGSQTAYPRQGQASIALGTTQGTNRVEAQVLRATRGGMWTFDLSTAGAAPGSLRILLGDVARITPTSVTFQLRGVPGERLAFTFAGR